MRKLIVMIAVCVLLALVLGACSSTTTVEKEEPFTVNLNSPSYEAGVTDVYMERYMSIGSLRKDENIIVSYYPNEDAVCLQFKIQFAHGSQFWSKSGREAFVKAFEQYKQDYEQRKLSKGNKRNTGRVYGSTMGYFAWKKTIVGTQAHGSPKVEFGYYIKDNAAFFSTAQLESYYEDPMGHSRNQTSPIIRMYFTRAQAEALVTLFNEDYLKGLLSFRSGIPAPGTTDTYTEAE